MLLYVLRRLGWTALTVFGVMVLTFLLFRVGAGDIAAVFTGEKASRRARMEWRHKHGYDLPWILNYHRRLAFEDRTRGPDSLRVESPPGSNAVNALGLILASQGRHAAEAQQRDRQDDPNAFVGPGLLVGRYVGFLGEDTPVRDLTDEVPLAAGPPRRGAATAPAAAAPPPRLTFILRDGSTLTVDLAGVETAGDVVAAINDAPDNKGRLAAGFTDWRVGDLVDSQFFHHLWNSIRFQARDLRTGRKLTTILAEHAPKSLAITVPALAIGWALAMIISSYVAYYHGRFADHLTVFLCVLGMCVPFLAYMILGQALMFAIAPAHAYGVQSPANVYLPVAIMVVSGLGGSVRFYRTVILDERNRDYVRTARAKGAPLPTVLFKHVLKNCMLPILTNLVASLPFLVMGNLLVEKYFGIPGLGDLMLSSITNRQEPILSGIVFLIALVYSLGILLTDLSYAVFDPRVRLR